MNQMLERKDWGDTVIQNGWLYVNDPTGETRWSLRVDTITGWYFNVGQGSIVIETPGRTFLVTSADPDDPFTDINNLDDLLWMSLVDPRRRAELNRQA